MSGLGVQHLADAERTPARTGMSSTQEWGLAQRPAQKFAPESEARGGWF